MKQHKNSITRLAPAKLNLFLHITGRRPDGYHLLQSVFMLIDWCDTLHFSNTTDGKITRTDLVNETGKPLPEMDLAVRAALALQAASGVTFGVHIKLEKRIPSQAGMGGGSSDAAATLLALNQLWGTQLPLAELAAIGIKLGADVPFFLYEQHAWVEGIGERITPLPLPAARYLVVKPLGGVPTPAVFAAPALKRDTKDATIAGFAALNEKCAALEGQELFGCNDLQPVAQALCPDIELALRWFESQGLKPRMTGSGSAVFAQVGQFFDLSLAPCLPLGWMSKLCSNRVTRK